MRGCHVAASHWLFWYDLSKIMELTWQPPIGYIGMVYKKLWSRQVSNLRPP